MDDTLAIASSLTASFAAFLPSKGVVVSTVTSGRRTSAMKLPTPLSRNLKSGTMPCWSQKCWNLIVFSELTVCVGNGISLSPGGI